MHPVGLIWRLSHRSLDTENSANKESLLGDNYPDGEGLPPIRNSASAKLSVTGNGKSVPIQDQQEGWLISFSTQ